MSRLSDADIAALISATHREPRSVLGYHELPREGAEPECVVRVLEPDAVSVGVYWEDETPEQARPLVERHPSGVFEGTLNFRRPIMPYRLHIRYRNGHEATKYDPYYFGPQITEFDLHLFGEGNHHNIYSKLGAHPMTASSAISISGTAAVIRCMRSDPPASGSCSSPASASARCTSSRSSHSTAA